MPPLTTSSTLQVSGTKPNGVTESGTALTEQGNIAGLKSAGTGWYWDAKQQLTFVKIGLGTTTRMVLLDGVDKAAYEAEFAAQTGTSTNENHTGFTGIGFVDGFTSVGDAVEFDVLAEASGGHTFTLRYANGTGSAATREVMVNGVSLGSVTFPPLANWDTWGTAAVSTTLSAGKHSFRVNYGSANSGAINLDNLVLSRP